MDTNQVNFWLSINAENFTPETLPVVKNKLEQIDKSQMMFLQSASFKKPSTIFLIALFLGWERFLLNDIALGIVKVITAYGCGIWWLIDIFTAKKRAQKYNFQQFQKATAMISGGISMPTAPTINTAIPETQQTTTQSQQYEFGAVAPTTQNKSISGGKIVLLFVAIILLIGGGLFVYHNWDSWFKPNAPVATDILNRYNSQMGKVNNTGGSSLEEIFSETNKVKQVKEQSSKLYLKQQCR